MPHAPSYKVSSTYLNTGSKRRTVVGTRRPNQIQLFLLTPSFQAVADSLKFCPMVCLFVIIFQKSFSKNLPLMEIMSRQNMPTGSGIFPIYYSFHLPSFHLHSK